MFILFPMPTPGRSSLSLSPYLIILCAEGLKSLLKYAEDEGSLVGVKVFRAAPAVAHLLFTDDSLILMSADLENADSLHQVLQAHNAALGKLVREAKSGIFFSQCTSVEMREAICLKLNILTKAITGTYMGLPTQVGVDRSYCFIDIIERVLKRPNVYKEKLL
jgi:hypothetical protein